MNGFAGFIVVSFVAFACQASATSIKEVPLTPWEILSLSGYPKDAPCDSLRKQAESIIIDRPGSSDNAFEVLLAAVTTLKKMPANDEVGEMIADIESCINASTSLRPWEVLKLAGYSANNDLSVCEALEKQAKSVAAGHPGTSVKMIFSQALEAIEKMPASDEIQTMANDIKSCA